MLSHWLNKRLFSKSRVNINIFASLLLLSASPRPLIFNLNIIKTAPGIYLKNLTVTFLQKKKMTLPFYRCCNHLAAYNFFFPPPVNQHSRKYLFKTFYSIVICKWASASSHREWRMVKLQAISMLRCLANCLSSWSCLTFHFQGELKPSLGSELCL